MFAPRFLQILTPFVVCFLSLLPIVPMDKNLLPNQSLGTQLESTVLNLFAALLFLEVGINIKINALCKETWQLFPSVLIISLRFMNILT